MANQNGINMKLRAAFILPAVGPGGSFLRPELGSNCRPHKQCCHSLSTTLGP